MNELEKLAHLVRQEFPFAELSLNDTGPPGRAWLDIEYEGRAIAVEWRRDAGFGVSVLPDPADDAAAGLFEGPDEVFQTVTRAQDFIVSVFGGVVRKSQHALAR